MSSTMSSLLAQAERLTAQNNAQGGAAPAPPPVAAQSPLHEVLIAELAASLPAPIAARLRAAPTAAGVQDWLAAGALYRLAAGDPHLSATYLAELGACPAQANAALARALASRMEPPEPGADWTWCDRVGLYLQLGLAALLLVCRAALLMSFAAILSGAWTVLGTGEALLGDGLLSARTEDNLVLVLLACFAAWLGAEACAGPWLMERVRRLPAWCRGLPPPQSWRADAFHVAWCLQAGLLALLVCGRLVLLACLAPHWGEGLVDGPYLPVLVAAGVAGLVAARAHGWLLGPEFFSRAARTTPGPARPT